MALAIVCQRVIVLDSHKIPLMSYRKKYSKTITSDPDITHIALRVDVRYFRIPVRWSVEEIPDVEETDERYALVPKVESGQAIQLDPFKLRSQFLKLDIDDQEQTLDFLNYIGVWNINEQTGEDFMRIARAVGHRYVSGYASPFTVGALNRAQERARHQMLQLEKHRTELRSCFGPPPQSRDSLAHAAKNRALNTLPLHFEWKQQPIGVIQPVTGHEMLNATLQVDLFTGAPVHVCAKCNVRFTSKRSRRYCSDTCMRAAVQKEYRERKKAEEKFKSKNKNWRQTV
jgi:hypothetical protein